MQWRVRSGEIVLGVQGGLGNQLFQFAFATELARRGRRVLFDTVRCRAGASVRARAVGVDRRSAGAGGRICPRDGRPTGYRLRSVAHEISATATVGIRPDRRGATRRRDRARVPARLLPGGTLFRAIGSPGAAGGARDARYHAHRTGKGLSGTLVRRRRLRRDPRAPRRIICSPRTPDTVCSAAGTTTLRCGGSVPASPGIACGSATTSTGCARAPRRAPATCVCPPEADTTATAARSR